MYLMLRYMSLEVISLVRMFLCMCVCTAASPKLEASLENWKAFCETDCICKVAEGFF